MDSFQKFYDKTLRFLSFRPRSEKEIRDYLKRPRMGRSREKQEPIEESVVEKIITRLKDQNFINDEEFAKWLIEQRQGSKPRGIRVIKMELKQKGISEDKFQNFLQQSGQAEFRIQNEKELAKQAALKKIVTYRKLPRMEFKQKMSQFLLRRGFDWETVREVVDETVLKEYNSVN